MVIRLRDLVRAIAVLLGTLAALPAVPGLAAEKVKVAVFPSVSALPYYVARERGLFAAEGIEAEQVVFQSHPLIFQALITGDADTASNTVTLEGANINLKRPGTAYFFALNAQNATFRGEVVVVREGFAATSIKEFKGKGVKILTAPGPANREAARAVFVANGLVEGTDFTLNELQMGDHVGALKAGTFDAGYTLEPFAHIMEKQGVARVIESGVIAKYIVGKSDGFVPAAGGVASSKVLDTRPKLAAGFATDGESDQHDQQRRQRARPAGEVHEHARPRSRRPYRWSISPWCATSRTPISPITEKSLTSPYRGTLLESIRHETMLKPPAAEPPPPRNFDFSSQPSTSVSGRSSPADTSSCQRPSLSSYGCPLFLQARPVPSPRAPPPCGPCRGRERPRRRPRSPDRPNRRHARRSHR